MGPRPCLCLLARGVLPWDIRRIVIVSSAADEARPRSDAIFALLRLRPPVLRQTRRTDAATWGSPRSACCLPVSCCGVASARLHRRRSPSAVPGQSAPSGSYLTGPPGEGAPCQCHPPPIARASRPPAGPTPDGSETRVTRPGAQWLCASGGIMRGTRHVVGLWGLGAAVESGAGTGDVQWKAAS